MSKTFEQDEKIDDKNVNLTAGKVLICPTRDSRIDSSLTIAVAESLDELVNVINSGALAVSIANVRLLECLVEYSDMFLVELVNFTGVPGADYSTAYDQIMWQVPRVGYDAVVLEAASAERMSKLKQDERPRAAGNRPVAETTEEVSQMKIPNALDMY